MAIKMAELMILKQLRSMLDLQTIGMLSMEQLRKWRLMEAPITVQLWKQHIIFWIHARIRADRDTLFSFQMVLQVTAGSR